MKVSVCITTFNEEKSIGKLLDSLLSQSKKPDEIVIVDGGSKDKQSLAGGASKTVEIIRHFQKKDKRIKLLVQKCSRAQGRNLGVEIAKNDIIAITDGGCVAHRDWLEKITAPFVHKEVDISAGFYKMTGETPYQKAISVFLGVTPSKFGVDFLPSSRSIAFRKEAWERIGGFPERNVNTAEDTDFNYKAVKLGMKYARVKSAIVEWGMPQTFREGIKKFYEYAKWDGMYGIWWHPTQRLSSHNIKVIFVFMRYLAGITLVVLGVNSPLLWWIVGIGLIFYLFRAYRKVYLEFRDWRAGVWGSIIQFSSDFAVMLGFLRGIIGKKWDI